VSTLKLREQFTLDSAPDRVWAFLVDPARTVSCLPGAEITAQDDERTYSGAVRVKVGAVQVAYRGKVVFEEIDEARRYVRVVGKGRERTGSGSAEMTMEGRVSALEEGGAEVTVDAEVRVTGKIVRFGRGMIESVSAEIFEEFRTRLAASLTGDAAEGHAAAESGAQAPETPSPGSGDGKALSLLPLLLRALRSWLRRLQGRA
jgi:carbon monoxide dehydrogenase subunit G